MTALPTQRLDYSLMTRCRRGHDLTVPDAVHTDDRGKRQCAACMRARRKKKPFNTEGKWFDGKRWLAAACAAGHDISSKEKRDLRGKCMQCRIEYNKVRRSREAEKHIVKAAARARARERMPVDGNVLVMVEAMNLRILAIGDRIDFASTYEREMLRAEERQLVRRKDALLRGLVVEN